MKENKFRNADTMKAIAETITAQKEFCELYSLTDANMNSNVEQSNRVTVIAETVELAREIIETTHLQNDFFNAVSRITIWVDSNAIVVFVGAVFAVHTRLSESEKVAEFSELFKNSIDEKYNERTLRKKKITALTETRHSFESLDEFKAFFNLLAELVTLRKNAIETNEQREQRAKEQAEKEQAEREKAEREQAEKERVEREQAEQKAKAEKEKAEQKAREKAEQKAQKAREKAEQKAQKAKEKAEQKAKENKEKAQETAQLISETVDNTTENIVNATKEINELLSSESVENERVEQLTNEILDTIKKAQ